MKVRTLRPLADPTWGHAPPGAELEFPPAEAEALRQAGLAEPLEPVRRRPEAATNQRRERAAIPPAERR